MGSPPSLNCIAITDSPLLKDYIAPFPRQSDILSIIHNFKMSNLWFYHHYWTELSLAICSEQTSAHDLFSLNTWFLARHSKSSHQSYKNMSATLPRSQLFASMSRQDSRKWRDDLGVICGWLSLFELQCPIMLIRLMKYILPVLIILRWRLELNSHIVYLITFSYIICLPNLIFFKVILHLILSGRFLHGTKEVQQGWHY